MRHYQGIDLRGISDSSLRDKLRIIDRSIRDMNAAISLIAPTAMSGSAATGSAADDEAFVVTAASTGLSNERVIGATSPVTTTLTASTITIGITFSTNQVGITSTVPDVAGNYAFDFKDTIAANRTGTSYLWGIRDSVNTYRFRVQSTGNTKIILGNSAATASSTMNPLTWTMGDNAAGTSSDPALKVTGSLTDNTDDIITAGTKRGLIFRNGSNNAAGTPRMAFQEDGSGGTANDNYFLFQKQNPFDNVTANDWMQWDWASFGGFPVDARRFFHGTIDNTNDVYISQGGRWGNQSTRVGYANDVIQWQTWDITPGGRMKFTGVGTTEPVT